RHAGYAISVNQLACASGKLSPRERNSSTISLAPVIGRDIQRPHGHGQRATMIRDAVVAACACGSKHRRTRINGISWPRRSDSGSRCSTRAHQGHIAHSVAVLQLTHASRELSACEREDVTIDLALVI